MGLNLLRRVRVLYFLLAGAIFPYFVILFHITPVSFDLSYVPVYNYILNLIGVPLMFSLPWLIVVVLYRDQITYGFVLMLRDTNLIPKRWRIFYGFNAAAILLFLGFPLGTPIFFAISILAVYGRMIGHFIDYEKRTWLSWALWVIGSIAVCYPLGLFLLRYLPSAIPFFSWLIEQWMLSIPLIYLVSTLMVSTLTIGEFFAFLYKIRSVHEMSIMGVKFTEPPFGKIASIEVLFFVSLVFTAFLLQKEQRLIISAISLFCLGLMAFKVTMRLLLKIKKTRPDNTIAGFIFAVAFLVLYVLEITNILVLSALLSLAAFLFVLSFLQGFIRAANMSLADLA
ncbi:MAG: hypothetical protein ACTSW4_06985 [Candidatus Ranarchaeia archaeon]